MPIPGIVTGQHVSPGKLDAASKHRRRMTPAERILWQRPRASRLRGWHVRRQQVIDGFIVDFHCHAKSLVTELDGGVHGQEPEYDRERGAILTAQELRIPRIHNKEVLQNLPEVLERIAAACSAPDAGDRSTYPPVALPFREGGTLRQGQGNRSESTSPPPAQVPPPFGEGDKG